MAERWNTKRGKRLVNPAIDAFVADIDAVCKKHGLSISHEDGHGAFEIVRGEDAGGLHNAHDSTEEDEEENPAAGRLVVRPRSLLDP